MTRILHANWTDGRLHFWAEDPARLNPAATLDAGEGLAHPFAASLVPGDLARLHPALADAAPSKLALRLPATSTGPVPSPALAALAPSPLVDDDAADAPDALPVPAALRVFGVESISCDASRAAEALLTLDEALTRRDALADDGLEQVDFLPGPGLAYFAALARFARHLMSRQRVVPTLVQTVAGELKGAWHPWLGDEETQRRGMALVGLMPGAARASVDRLNHDPVSISEDFLASVIDAECRSALVREGFAQSIEGRKTADDPHVAWLSGLLRPEPAMSVMPAVKQELSKRVRAWLSVLEDRGASALWRLLLRLGEPPETDLEGGKEPGPTDPAWTLSFHLQAVEKPSLVLDAEDVWLLTADSVTVQGRRVDKPQELLLAELGRAMRLYPRLEPALDEPEPSELHLTTRQAYEFLREHRQVLLEQGFGVEVPPWWDTPVARLGAKLRLESEEEDPFAPSRSAGSAPAATSKLGLGALIRYRWEIAVGDTTLSLKEFEQLASRRQPLVRVNGRWVEIRPEDVEAAIKFMRGNPGGDIHLGEALRMAYASDVEKTGIPVVGLEATGWLKGFLSGEAGQRQMRLLETPASFRGTLRPYQGRGVSWMAFQEALGFGVCLADDMGLGKTVQLLALLASEREGLTPHPPVAAAHGDAAPPSAPAHGVLPTLLIVPMSVVGNWIHETARFCPHLRVLVHHGATREQGESFLARARESDLVLCTYALAHRDRDLLKQVKWGRIVLDEAQYIKNPAAKQSQAVRDFQADRRVALTGTPVENRLTELWSIMDFLNPGYLGGAAGFRQRFGVPIERHHDKVRAEQLKGLIRPFVLRRLKSDPTVVADLPEKVETTEFVHLTSEQAALYESCVRRMLAEVESAEGIQRRGLVLAALVKLKQICNHPSLLLKDQDAPAAVPDPTRSGKCIRLLEILDEILAERDQCLIFTQFRQMGNLLVPMLRQHLGREVLFLHGGTTQAQRQQIIDQFQRADGTHPILLLSLRAGGVGLNLTAATHVVHFDRWWNPAVENQATDRAYRIGQSRTVQVHKFVVSGTLEERIDQMIQSKTALAENIIGAGEAWLTELDTTQLREILTLRNDAVDDVP